MQGIIRINLPKHSAQIFQVQKKGL
jgi:hypothetical protein